MGALAGPIAGGAASALVGGMMSKGGGGNSGSYQENTPYVPRERPSYMPTQQQYMMPSYYSPVSYGRYQAPAQAPFMPAPAQPRGMMGGMNLIDLSFNRDPEGNMGFGAGDYLSRLTNAGIDQKKALMYMLSSGAGLFSGAGVKNPVEALGLDPSQVITIGGRPYLIG